MQNDPVNSPAHYTRGKIEVIDFLEDQDMGPHIGTAVKYLCRAPYKHKEREDLEKAIWFINRRIEQIKKNRPETRTREVLDAVVKQMRHPLAVPAAISH